MSKHWITDQKTALMTPVCEDELFTVFLTSDYLVAHLRKHGARSFFPQT